MAYKLKNSVYKISGIIKARCPIVREDFVTKAVRAHWQGRFALTVVTTGVMLLILFRSGWCIGGWIITGIAWAWTAISFLVVCGARPREKEEGVDMNVGSRMRFDYKQWSKYPWWSFFPDIFILTAMVIHTGGAFSLFIPMFLVLGTLGDHTLIAWPWRRIFLPAFIFVPYTIVILLSTPI